MDWTPEKKGQFFIETFVWDENNVPIAAQESLSTNFGKLVDLFLQDYVICMSKFSLVAMGGTFDIIHRGHLTLLANAFEISNKVIIGLTSDEFVKKKGKKPVHKYDERLRNLLLIIFKEFPNILFEISQLDNDFGPAVLEKEVQALVVSDETKNQGNILNKLRTERNISPVEIIVVPMTLAKDGKRISTTRIKNSEIDSDGNLLPID